MHVQRITTLEQLDALRPDWNRLAGGAPFRRWEWMRSWWVHFGRGRELFVLVVRDDHDEVVGIAPWFLERSLATGREIRFLGGDALGEYLSLLCSDSHQHEVPRAVALWLAEAQAAESSSHNVWDLLRFTGLETGDPAIQHLKNQLKDSVGTVNEKAATSCWRIPIPGTWDEYLRSRPNPHRRKIRQLKERMLDNGRATVSLATDQRDVSSYFETLVALHQKRRESLRQQGCFATSAFQEFLFDVVNKFSETEHLFLAKLTIDGRAAAMLLGLIFGKVNYVYQCGMAPELSAHQPGWLLNIHTVQHAIRRQLSGVDFLCGDQPYKAHLGALAVPMTQLSISAPRRLAIFRHRLMLSGERLKNWLHPL